MYWLLLKQSAFGETWVGSADEIDADGRSAEHGENYVRVVRKLTFAEAFKIFFEDRHVTASAFHVFLRLSQVVR